MAKDTDLREDIAAAKDKMRVKFGGGREIKRLVTHLNAGETVERLTTGQYGKGIGLVALTNQRLLFLKDGMTGHQSEDFPISKISSVSWTSGLATGSIVVFVSGNKAEISGVQKHDGKEMVELIRPRIADGAAPSSSPAQPDVMDQLKKLGELRDAGVLSQEEFDAKKTEMLGRM